MSIGTKTTTIAGSAVALVGLVAIAGCNAATSNSVAGAAKSSAPTRTPIAVSIGDSFISGEGGRFAGNMYTKRISDGASDSGPHNKGQEVYRDAWGGHDFQKSKFLGITTDSNEWCHRSESAEINSTKAAFGWTPVNLACSGAVTDNVLKDGYRTEKAQVTQLENLAKDPKYDVKAVVVSIGGNDLGFSDLLSDAVQYTRYHDINKEGIWDKATKKRDKIKTDITNTLNKITDVMRANGYADGSYKFVYQSYSNIFAGSDNRYMSVDHSGQFKRDESPGVPLSNATVDFSRSTMVPWITDMQREAKNAATNRNIQFMNLTNALAGHELSNKDTKFTLKSSGVAPQANDAEWVVAINDAYIRGSLGSTQRHQESFHPNMFGQQAYGTCLVNTLNSSSGEVTCVGQPGKAPSQVVTTGR